MGLDMYAYKVPKKLAKGDFEIDESFTNTDDTELAYWRKHHVLHGWFYLLYLKKGGKGGCENFNCVPVRLTLEDLDTLKKAILIGAFNEDYRYKFSDDERDYDLKFVKRARKAINDGYEVYYDSWW